MDWTVREEIGLRSFRLRAGSRRKGWEADACALAAAGDRGADACGRGGLSYQPGQPGRFGPADDRAARPDGTVFAAFAGQAVRAPGFDQGQDRSSRTGAFFSARPSNPANRRYSSRGSGSAGGGGHPARHLFYAASIADDAGRDRRLALCPGDALRAGDAFLHQRSGLHSRRNTATPGRRRSARGATARVALTAPNRRQQPNRHTTIPDAARRHAGKPTRNYSRITPGDAIRNDAGRANHPSGTSKLVGHDHGTDRDRVCPAP